MPTRFDAAASTTALDLGHDRADVITAPASASTSKSRGAPLLAEAPDTITVWKVASQRLLSDECCAFHRNMEISSRYAELYRHLPECFKWTAMAAIASHHVRLALFPLRVDADRSGYADIPRHLRRRQKRLAEDVNTIRRTNNAIFDDIYWVHLAYVTGDGGMERLRSLLREDATTRPYSPASRRSTEAVGRWRTLRHLRPNG